MKITRAELYKRIDDWANVMWDDNQFDHEEWTGPDEVAASIKSYVEGKHLK